jgi:hypothetical protein
LLLIFLAICGCRPEQKKGSGTAARQPAASTTESPWLNPDAVISEFPRMRAPEGTDVREAAYWKPAVGVENAGNLRMLALLRDYANRTDGLDPQRVVAFNIDTAVSATVAASGDGTPFGLTVAPGHDKSVVPLYRPGTDATRGKVSLICFGYGDKPLSVAPQPTLLPLAVQADGTVLLRGIEQLEIEKGLVSPSVDWDGTLQQLDVPAAALTDSGRHTFLPAADDGVAAGYVAQFDPALPTAAQIRYLVSGAAGKDTEFELPYYLSPASTLWQPSMAWGDADSLLTVAYLPGARRAKAGGSADGLFRIVRLDTDGGRVSLIEDHVSPDTSLVSSGGVIWYALRNQRSAAGTWEVWVSSPDGLRKSLVWSTTKTAFLEVLDSFEHRRILLHRQFFAEGDTPQLVSELLELSLDRLNRTPVEKEAEKLQAPAFEVEEEAPADTGPPLMSGEPPPPSDDSGDPPLFIPDSPGGGGSGPPPIAP